MGINGELTQLFWQKAQDPGIMATVNPASGPQPEQHTIEVVGSCISDDSKEQDAVAPAHKTFSVKAL